ncbi:hypothetical protein C8J56DRAFT_762202, partial [Mycena floridula]
NCDFCKQQVKGANEWRAHMGQHVLLSLRGVTEPGLQSVIESPSPCGFCGHSGRDQCAPFIIIKKKVIHVESKCPSFAPIAYASANRGSRATPCHNVPIICSLC